MVKSLLLIINFTTLLVFSQPFPDRHYYYEKENLVQRVDSLNGMEIGTDGKSLVLSEGVTTGFVIFEADSSESPYNRGLPSWNGYVPNDSSSFKVLMRFYHNGWSPWLTVGFWKANIWQTYGLTNYSGGEIDIDYVILNTYHSNWQFRVDMKRLNNSLQSPEIYKLSFFVSDQITTDNVNITSLVNDNPEAIFIDTQHFWQYSIDPEIGGSICSPTSVCMVLRSYNIEVDPLQFALDTYCPYWGIFGIWPRVVQNAAESGLDGAVTRYRTWSDAREILNQGGRVVMSVGSPLYPNGHLMMLAGFDSSGKPIVHDPARSDGYGYIFSKTDLSRSWFKKGGIAYTFFPEGTTGMNFNETASSNLPQVAYLSNNYPNPFNPSTRINFSIAKRGFVSLKVYDILGNEIITLVNEEMPQGHYELEFSLSKIPNKSLSSGIYIYTLRYNDYSVSKKMSLLK